MTMLSQKFYNVWYVGEINEDGVDKIIECLLDYSSKAIGRVKLRFYLNNIQDLSYIAYVRRILLQNTSLSIVIEERLVEDLERDIKSAEDEVVVIKNRGDLEIPLSEKIKIVEV